MIWGKGEEGWREPRKEDKVMMCGKGKGKKIRYVTRGKEIKEYMWQYKGRERMLLWSTGLEVKLYKARKSKKIIIKIM